MSWRASITCISGRQISNLVSSHYAFHPAPLRVCGRTFSSSTCPFRTLKISREVDYATAKKAFLKLAMDNHPDIINQRFMNNNQNTSDMSEEEIQELDKKKEVYLQKSVERFQRAKKAFDDIVETDDGNCALRIEIEAEEELEKNSMSEAEFDAWFLNETGHANPYNFDIDAATAREVAEVTSTMGGGLDRDGGMWTLANMISEGVKSGTKDVLKLEAGEIKEDSNENRAGVRRRRRR